MKTQTYILKFALLLISIPVLALCIFVIPQFAKVAAQDFIKIDAMQYILMVGVYASAFAYYVAIWQTYKLLTFIDQQDAFSARSVKALQGIKYCGFVISAIYVCAMPIFFIIADKDDAPGLILFGAAFVFAAFAVAIFAAVLQKLLQQAIEIRIENELTV